MRLAELADGTPLGLDADGTVDWLVKYALMTPDRARKYLSFIARYRSYVINYNYGKRLVREYVEAQAGDDPQRRFPVALPNPLIPAACEGAALLLSGEARTSLRGGFRCGCGSAGLRN